MAGHFTYLIFELAWGLPVIILQWLVGARALRAHPRTVLLGTALPTAYLVLADSFAIRAHIWTLHAARLTGILLGNVPIEEAIFFLITNTLVAQSVVLVAERRLLRPPRRSSTK